MVGMGAAGGESAPRAARKAGPRPRTIAGKAAKRSSRCFIRLPFPHWRAKRQRRTRSDCEGVIITRGRSVSIGSRGEDFLAAAGMRGGRGCFGRAGRQEWGEFRVQRDSGGVRPRLWESGDALRPRPPPISSFSRRARSEQRDYESKERYLIQFWS